MRFLKSARKPIWHRCSANPVTPHCCRASPIRSDLLWACHRPAGAAPPPEQPTDALQSRGHGVFLSRSRVVGSGTCSTHACAWWPQTPTWRHWSSCAAESAGISLNSWHNTAPPAPHSLWGRPARPPPLCPPPPALRRHIERIASGVLGWGCLSCKLSAPREPLRPPSGGTRCQSRHLPSPVWATSRYTLGWLFHSFMSALGLGQNTAPWAFRSLARTSTTAWDMIKPW